jgi:hypothetical protein
LSNSKSVVTDSLKFISFTEINGKDWEFWWPREGWDKIEKLTVSGKPEQKGSEVLRSLQMSHPQWKWPMPLVGLNLLLVHCSIVHQDSF